MPFYAELDPRLPKTQGGMGLFNNVPLKYFDRFMSRDDLGKSVDVPEPQPILELASLLDSLTGNKFTEALLLLQE